jgi:hypothetical protein
MGKLAGLVVMLGAIMFVSARADAAEIIVQQDVPAAPGTDVAVTITLGTQGQDVGEEVAGTQNDITFDPALANLTALNRCVINPEISDDAAGCEDDPNSGPCKQLNRALDDVEGGRRFRGLILSLANTTTIMQGTLLYTCTFTVASDAALGTTIPLACSNAGASDPDGGAITTTCQSGSIVVALANTATPTATATTEVTVAPPTTPPTTGPTTVPPTNTPDGEDDDDFFDEDDDGCQMVGPGSSHTGWLLFAPAALLLWRRRSR